MLEIIFSACIILAAFISVGVGYMDYGSAAVIFVMMLIWQMLYAIHKTLCEILYKTHNGDGNERNSKIHA